MSRRDVIRSRQKSITARLKPGAAARTYAAKARGAGAGPAVRGVAATQSAVDQHRGAGRSLLGTSPDPTLGKAFGTRQNVDPRMGHRVATADEALAAWNLGQMPGTVSGQYTTRPSFGVGAIGIPPVAEAKQYPRGLVGGTIEDHGDLSDFEINRSTGGNFIDEYISSEQDRMSELIALRNLAIAEGQAEVAEGYNEQIAQIQKGIADAKQAKVDVAAAFERYRGTVDPYLQASVDAAAATDLSALQAMQGADAVTAEFNSGVAAVDAVLAKIAPGNEDLAMQLEGSVREFQQMAEDQLRGDMSSAYRVAEAGAKYAKNMAEYLQQQDEAMTDLEKQKIETEINAQIEQLQEQLAATEKAKAEAMSAVARDIGASYGLPGYFGSAEELFTAALDEWVALEGLSPQDRDDIMGIVSTLSAEGVEGYAAAREYLRNIVADNNLNALGDSLNVDIYDLMSQLSPQAQGLLHQWAANPTGVDVRPLAAVLGEDFMSNLSPDDLDSIDNYAPALEAWGLWEDSLKDYNENKAYSQSYGHAIADGYGYQGGTSSYKGKQYQGGDLDQLIYDAALYVYQGDGQLARAAVESGAMQRIIKSESGGYVGRLNYAGTAELAEAGLNVMDGYNTQAFLHMLEGASLGQFSDIGWPQGKDGKRHSASGLGQLNASNYRRYVPEFGGVAGVGNAFIEAVAAIRYALGAHGTLSKALAYKLQHGNW